MKKSSLRNIARFSALIALSLLWIPGAGVRRAAASPELDRNFRLQKIGVLRPWDNVDGLFADLVSDAVADSLRRESRFQVTDLRKSSAALASAKTPYLKLLEDPSILMQIAKVQSLDALVRSKVTKEGPRYRFDLALVYGRTAQVLATEPFIVQDPFLAGSDTAAGAPEGSQAFKTALRDAVARLIAQIPFRGMLTGRDAAMITLDLGARSGMRKGDRVVIGTLEEVKEHPLLKKIVDWRFSTTGRATITDVDDGLSFAKIDAEEPGHGMQRYQKVLQVIAAPEASPSLDSKHLDAEERRKAAEAAPTIGYFGPTLFFGSNSQDTTVDAKTQSASSGAFGFAGDAQIWLTSRWFTDLSLAFSAGGASHLSQFRLGGGYFLPFSEAFFGPKAFVRASYQSIGFTESDDASGTSGSSRVNGLIFGLGGDLPLRENYGLGMALDFGPFSGASGTANAYGTTSGATSANLQICGYQWIQTKLKFQVQVDFRSDSIDFVNGSSISHKIFTIGPALLLYF